MTFCTLIPFPFMLATVNGEIRLVMLCEVIGGPAGIRGMADNAVGWEIAGFMVRTGSCLIISRMTSKAVRRRIHKIPSDMAFRTLVYRMSFGQREEQMVCSASCPKPI